MKRQLLEILKGSVVEYRYPKDGSRLEYLKILDSESSEDAVSALRVAFAARMQTPVGVVFEDEADSDDESSDSGRE